MCERSGLKPSLFIALAVVFFASTSIGFDATQAQETPPDKGGVQLLLRVTSDPAKLDQDIEQTKSVIQNRCEQLKVYCKLERLDSSQITLRFSTSLDATRVKNVLLSNGLEFCAVVSESSPAPFRKYATRAAAMDAAATVNSVLPYKQRDASIASSTEVYIVVKREPIISGQDISNAAAVSTYNVDDDFRIVFQLKKDSAQKFAKWTASNIGKYIAVVLDKKVQSVAYIKSEISDSGEISGIFTKEEAEDIARVLRSGNLPAPIEVLREEMYKP